VAVLLGGAILFPSLILLFRLTLGGQLRPGGAAHRDDQPPAATLILDGLRTRLRLRSAAGLLVAGVGLLNLADAAWAHAVGVICLLAFVVTAFPLAVFEALTGSPAGSRTPDGRR
jgi:cytochrome d ubiquinol oxidase subunit II